MSGSRRTSKRRPFPKLARVKKSPSVPHRGAKWGAIHRSSPALQSAPAGCVRSNVLVPEVVAYAVQTALTEIRHTLSRDDPEKLRERLAQIDAARERLLDAIEDGSVHMEDVKRRLGRLRTEEADVRSRLLELEAEPLDAASRPQIEQRTFEMRAALEGAADERRARPQGLPGGRPAAGPTRRGARFPGGGAASGEAGSRTGPRARGPPGRSYRW
jgi:hypothetical protein